MPEWTGEFLEPMDRAHRMVKEPLEVILINRTRRLTSDIMDELNRSGPDVKRRARGDLLLEDKSEVLYFAAGRFTLNFE
jgi:hypothetical protein